MKSSVLTAIFVAPGSPVLPLPDLFARLFLPHLVGVVETLGIVPINFKCKVFVRIYETKLTTLNFSGKTYLFFFNYINSNRTKGRGHWMTTTMVPSDFQRTDIRFNPNEWMYRAMMKFQFHVLREHVQWPGCE